MICEACFVRGDDFGEGFDVDFPANEPFPKNQSLPKISYCLNGSMVTSALMGSGEGGYLCQEYAVSPESDVELF